LAVADDFLPEDFFLSVVAMGSADSLSKGGFDSFPAGNS